MTAPEPTGEALATFPVKETLWRSQPPGKLLFFHDRLRIEIEGRPVCELFHADRCGHSELTPWTRTFTIKTPEKREFLLDRDTLRAMQGWIGPPTPADLKLALKRLFGWAMPLGGFLILSSLPMGGLPFSLTGCIKGTILIFITLLSRVTPHRVFFLLDSIWFLVLAVTTALTALQDSNYWWILVVFEFLCAMHSIREFVRFEPGKMAFDKSPDS